MDVISIYRYARISPYKARKVTREIQGLPVSQALDIVTFTPQKAALLVGKTLRSAIANAENNHDLDADRLVVKECVVGEGPSFRRFKARARGSAAPIRRHTSHIRVVLSDEVDLKESKKGQSSKKKPAIAKKAAASQPKAAESAEEGTQETVEKTAGEATKKTAKKSGKKTTKKAAKKATKKVAAEATDEIKATQAPDDGGADKAEPEAKGATEA
jgi:large subunit ribosomal protein L22